ncbi:MAG: alpha/beta hydrolase [Pseudomonadales bacterium]|nr:alpha/beta hydrolase [Pseudomonadales bacterium]
MIRCIKICLNFFVLLGVALVASCDAGDLPYPRLHDLDAGDGVKSSGERLMDLPVGLHALEDDVTEPKIMLIGVHGYASEGYEWIYPLQTLDDNTTTTWFYRWNYNGCPGEPAEALRAAIEENVTKFPTIETVRVIGHSYGGVLVSYLIETDANTPLDIHAVAAPLAGMAGIGQRCDYSPPKSIGRNVSFHQWRTQHELDNAFNDLDEDPQIIDLPGAKVTVLPDTYRGRRLGHNWSISWVADELSGK